MALKIAELPPTNPDGSRLSRLDREKQIRELWPTVHERRLMAVKPYGLSKVDAFCMTPISLLHWLLDTMVKNKEIDGPILGVRPGEEVDPNALWALVQQNQALPPQEGEGISMPKNTIPPPPMSNIPPPPGAPGSNIPPPPGTGWAPPPPPTATKEVAAPPKKKRGRKKKTETPPAQESQNSSALEDVQNSINNLENLVSAFEGASMENIEVLLSRTANLEEQVNGLRESLSDVKAAVAVLLLGMYQKEGDPTNLREVLQSLNVLP